ncbi:hypothetical protein V1515DRAFT_645078 [Lipomyces mesembrius]
MCAPLLGISMCIKERDRGTTPTIRYYATREEKRAAIQEVERTLQAQLQANPFGPLEIGEDTLNPGSEKSRVYPPQSDAVIYDCRKGRIYWGEVPPNLAEITIGDCIPTHVLTGNNIEATPVHFFQQDWFENTFCFAMLETAKERVEDKTGAKGHYCRIGRYLSP